MPIQQHQQLDFDILKKLFLGDTPAMPTESCNILEQTTARRKHCGK